jgi:serine/threonine-protein kinase 24/25/MST4
VDDVEAVQVRHGVGHLPEKLRRELLAEVVHLRGSSRRRLCARCASLARCDPVIIVKPDPCCSFLPLEEDAISHEMLMELNSLRRCDHPNIVRYHSSYVFDAQLWIAMEYCSVSALGIMRQSRQPLAEVEVAAVCAEALRGLDYLHSVCRLIHRDVKAGNILLTEAGNVKLADFGVAAQISGTLAKRSTVIGSPMWMSPEMIVDGSYDFKTDIWSLGISALEMVMGEPPHADEHPMRVLLLIPKADPPTLSGEQWSPAFRDFVAQCLQMDAKKRPSAKELLHHRWIGSARKSASLTTLVERYERLRADRPGEPASYNTRRSKPAYSAPAVLAPDGSWDFGPTPDSCRDLGSDGAPGAPPLTAASAAAAASGTRQRSEAASDDEGRHVQCSDVGLPAAPRDAPGLPSAAVPPLPPSQQLSWQPEQQEHSQLQPLPLLRHVSGHGSHRSRHSSGSSHTIRSQDATGSSHPTASASAPASCVPLVVAPVLARMLGVHQDKQVRAYSYLLCTHGRT